MSDREMNIVVYTKLAVIVITIFFLWFFGSKELKYIEQKHQPQIVEKCSTGEENFEINLEFNLNKVNYEKIFVKGIKITAYNPEENQTDDTPFIMASNRLVYEGAVALSRDLQKEYKLRYGDIIYIPSLEQYYIYEDHMNKRFTKSLDILLFNKEEAMKVNLTDQRIIIYKIKRS